MGLGNLSIISSIIAYIYIDQPKTLCRYPNQNWVSEDQIWHEHLVKSSSTSYTCKLNKAYLFGGLASDLVNEASSLVGTLVKRVHHLKR